MARRRTADRGYGRSHQRLRAQWGAYVAMGIVDCARCGQRIHGWDEWHLDHRDDRSGYLGPSHATCNSRAPHTKTDNPAPTPRTNW